MITLSRHRFLDEYTPVWAYTKRQKITRSTKMNFADVRNAYRNAPNPNQPISKDNYLAMLNIFGQLVPLAAIPDAYDTDFRRNLPGSGLSGFQVVSLLQRIEDAKTFANNNPLYTTAGEGIAENIRAILDLIPSGAAKNILNPLQSTVQNILGGNL